MEASGESRIPTARRSGLPRPAPPQLRVGAPFSLQGGSGPFSLSPTAAHDLPLPPPRPRPPHKAARFSAGDLPECGAARRGPPRPVSSGARLGQGEAWGAAERSWALTTAPDSAFSRQLARVTHGAQLYDDPDDDDDDHDDFDHDDSRRGRPDARLACLRDTRACWEGVAAPQPPCEPRLTRESVGARVVVGGVEPGTLRYVGRAAFAAGEWAGVELDLPRGKNDGSVDGVIYFTCRASHGIFAPLARVAPAPHDAAPPGMPGPAAAPTPAPTALPRQLTDSSPEGAECAGVRGAARRGDEGEEVAGSPGSPGDATCDDSSLGILTPDQMPDFTVTASASLGRSPSDEDVAALEDEVCEGAAAAATASGEGAACSGGRCEAKALPRWDSDPSVAALDEELFRSDVSAIIRELRSSAEATSSGGSSPSRPRPSPDTERFQRDEARLQQEDEDAHARHHQEVPAPAPGVVPRGRACPPLPEPREVPGGVDLARLPAVARRAAPLTTRLLLAAAAPGEVTPETEAAWSGGVVGVVGVGGAAMTTSAGSLDQGYQGDAECDPRSEGGTGTASSPTEDVRLFQGVIDVEADVSLGDDDHEADHHGGGAPRGDRSARIIDGKLYHAPRELARPHDPNASEMDSSGFYSDLDPRDRDAEDESARTDLEPVQEALGGGALHDSLLEDDSRGGASLHDSLLDEDTRADHSLDDDRSSASTLRPESKDPTLSDAHDAPPDPHTTTTTTTTTTTLASPADTLPPGTTIIPTSHAPPTPVIVAPATQPTPDHHPPTPPPQPQDTAPASDSPAGVDAEEESARARARTYDKPWLARPAAPRRREEPRRPLPPPPPMPKRNVQSKLKALLEAPREAPAEEARRPRQPRKNRWDDVMTKIAEGQREAPRGPPREVKSRLMEGVLAPAATLSPQAERIRQERRERRERRQAAATAAAAAAAAAAARRPLHTRGDRKRSSASIRSNRTSRAPSLDSLPADPSFASYSRGSSVDRSEASHKSNRGSPTPSLDSSQVSRRSVRPLHVSHHHHHHHHHHAPPSPRTSSSTSLCSTASGGGVSRASRDSRGLSSSSTPAPPAPPPRSSSSSSTATTTAAADKKRGDTTTTTATVPRRPRLDNIKATLNAKPARISQRKPADPVKAPRSLNTGLGAPRTGGHNGPAHTPSPLQDHVKRLEAEAAARAAEVKLAREEKEEVTRAVEALTVLLHHLANTYDPFSTPRLKAEVRRLNSQLTETRLSLDESSAALKRLQEREASTAEQHSKEVQALAAQHQHALDLLAAQHKLDLDLALEKHRKELSKFAEDQQTQRDEVSRAHTAEVEQLDGEWRAKLDVQHEKHLCALQELNTRHMHQLRELETTRRARERELEETNFRLQGEQEALKVQSKKLEETLLNDTDHRLAAVRKMCASLKSEVESLKSVVEMKNSEIHGLRSQVVEVDRLTSDLELARERAKSLQAKTEDLQAQMEKKSQQERSLVNEHRLLVETCQRESSVNKRLSLENEELAWKLRQREELIMSISAPPPSTSSHSSLDMSSRSSTSSTPRSATPQATPRSPRVARRACGSVSPCKSEPGRRRHRGGGGVEVAGGAGESPPPSPASPASPCVKAVVEKSNSVSFILDLTDGRPDASPDPHLSPRRRPHRTASLSAADRPRTPALAHVRRAARARAATLGRAPAEVNGGGGDGAPHVNGRRSTSESSENGGGGGEVSRVSPTGLAWTVPVRGPCAAPPAPPRAAPRQLLQDPQEDEYECAPRGEAPPRFLEAAGLALTSSSEAASDSELSQCSLKGGSSSPSDSDSEGAEGAPRPAPAVCPKEGAGEAMIPDELLQQYGGAAPLSPIGPGQTHAPRRRLHSAPSSDSDENTTPHNDHDDDEDDDDEAGPAPDVSWSEDVDVTSSSELHDDL